MARFSGIPSPEELRELRALVVPRLALRRFMARPGATGRAKIRRAKQ